MSFEATEATTGDAGKQTVVTESASEAAAIEAAAKMFGEESAAEAEPSEVEAPPAEAKSDKTTPDAVKSYKGIKRLQRKLEAEKAELEKNRAEAKARIDEQMASLTEATRVKERLDAIRKEPKKVLELLQEAGVTYDDLTRLKLEELNGGAPAVDPRVDEMQKQLAEFRAEQQRLQQENTQAQQRARELSFVNAASEFDEVATFVETVPNGKQELLSSAYDVGNQLAAELGRAPTDKEILTELEVRAAAFNRRAYERLSKKFNNQPGLVAGAEPAKTRGAPPKAISNSHGGAAVRDLSGKTQSELEAEAVRQLRAAFTSA